EYMAAETPAVNPEDTWRLYRALAVEAGASPEITVDSGNVAVGEMIHEDGRRFVWFINLSGTSVAVTPKIAGSGPLVPLGGQGSVTSVSLPPFGVEILEKR
ncbi:MAG: beta-mannosidase, partial [Demequinaceae bacterium]|nr:beta-mannosidase [Demequinaceae bacterium]